MLSPPSRADLASQSVLDNRAVSSTPMPEHAAAGPVGQNGTFFTFPHRFHSNLMPLMILVDSSILIRYFAHGYPRPAVISGLKPDW